MVQASFNPDNGQGGLTDFGYFTLSDHRYLDNPRTTGAFIAKMPGQAVHAEKIGRRSV